MFKKQSGINVDRRGFLLGTGAALGAIAVAGLAAPKIALAGGVDGMSPAHSMPPMLKR